MYKSALYLLTILIIITASNIYQILVYQALTPRLVWSVETHGEPVSSSDGMTSVIHPLHGLSYGAESGYIEHDATRHLDIGNYVLYGKAGNHAGAIP